jgi:4-amino-4-deoxy-L-arabinose transferase-like glycosyltransferase
LQPATPRARLITGFAVAIGASFWLLAGNDVLLVRWVVVVAVVGVAMIPPVNRALGKLLERLRNPSQRTAEWTGVIVGVLATAYLVGTAMLQERPLAPRMLDECSYAIGAQLLAHGHLWLPQHPLADFFDSFFLTVRPVYSSIYFPGTFVAFAPAVWFGWPTWIIPVVLSGASVGLLYRIITEIAGDGAAGLLAVIWAVSLMAFRALSVMTMSHVVLLFLGLLMMWLSMRWREASRRRWAWALAVGAITGWAAVTRPVDANAYALPVGVAMIVALLGDPPRRWAITFAMLVVGAAPFLGLQVAHNIGVTGSPLRTPYTEYLKREQPGAEFGIRTYDPSWQPQSESAQVRGYYNWVRPYLELHQPHNFWRPWFGEQRLSGGRVQPANFLTLVDSTLPARPLLLLLPAGVVALLARGRGRIFAATLPLFVLLYVFNPFFLPHYAVVVAPAVILVSLLGADAVARAMPGRRASDAVRIATYAAILALSVTSLWEVRWAMTPSTRPPADGFQERVPQSYVQTAIEMQVQPPAVVLYGAPPDLWTEMVYNTDVASPDDAPIIRAHDLGSRDAELIDYYGQRQPDRTIYRFDWRRGSLQRLGKAGELRERLPAAR